MIRNICLSGGARGSDVTWAVAASNAGHEAIAFSFEGHRNANFDGARRVILNEEQLKAADPYLTQAIIKLKRARVESRTDEVKRLLRRNWWQVRDADACYAVGSLLKNKIRGGTGYAVQMFIDRGLMSKNSGPWLFNQDEGVWLRYNRAWDKWELASEGPPRPEGKYAGIGTRDILPVGRAAIVELYK